LCSIACGAAIVVGTRQPALITELHLKDCVMPCWIGIIPGETTFDEGEALLYNTFGSKITKLASPYDRSVYYLLQIDATHFWKISFYNAAPTDTKGSIGSVPITDLSLARDNSFSGTPNVTADGGMRLTIGDLVSSFGAPTGVGLYGGHPALNFGDEFAAEIDADIPQINLPETLIISSCGMFNPYEEISSLTPSQNEYLLKQIGQSDWTGFRDCYSFTLPTLSP
jgi:hypothetical protein